jgi:hypothetical protein
MILRPFVHDPGSCAGHLFGCTTQQMQRRIEWQTTAKS